MKRFVVGLVGSGGSGVDGAQVHGPVQDRQVRDENGDGIIEAIEASTRTLHAQETGRYLLTTVAGPDITRFAEVKIGDTVNVRYYENVIVRVKRPGEPDVVSSAKGTTGSEQALPGGTRAKQVTITATITAIDPAAPSITFTGPHGWKYSSKVQDTEALAKVKVGDKVDIVWTEAMLVSVERGSRGLGLRPGRSAVIAPVDACAEARHLTTACDERPASRSHSQAKECAVVSKLSAEFVGTFWLVLGGCGSAVLAAAFPDVGIGLLGVSLAFGLTVLSGAYALGPISGGHFNPAVSVGLWAGGRFPAALLLPYTVAQVLGGIVGAGVLYLIASGRADFSLAAGFASNGYGAHSPGGYSLVAGLVCEVVMTFMFLIVILGTTHKRAPAGFAGLAIGLALTLIHLISIPVTNTSVNPARSTATAVFVGGWAVQQLWLFWLAPVIGAAIAGFVHQGGPSKAQSRNLR